MNNPLLAVQTPSVHIARQVRGQCFLYFVVVITLIGIASCIRKPEHSEIWYEYSDQNVHEVRMIDPNTRQQQNMSQKGNIGVFPELSPDGKYIISTHRLANGYALWIANTDGSNPHQVTREVEWIYHFWINDQTWL